MRFSIHDWTGGYRAIRKEVFLKEKDKLVGVTGYTFQVAFLHKALQDGFKVAEIPFHFIDRTEGTSKIASGQYIKNLLTYIITARIKELQRVVKFIFVGSTGFLVQIISQELSVILGFSHSIAVGVGAETAILSNFLFNHFWTFQDTKKVKESSNFFVKLLKFNTTSLAAIIVEVSAVYLGEKMFGTVIRFMSYNLPTRILILIPTIIFIVIPLNYLIYNKIIWKTQYLKDGKPSKA